MNIQFTWDGNKNKLNRQKHGVSFEEAKSVFYDERAIQSADPDLSDEEDRFLVLGTSEHLRLLMVCHCFRENDFIIRIISARKATRNEAKQYEGIDHEI